MQPYLYPSMIWISFLMSQLLYKGALFYLWVHLSKHIQIFRLKEQSAVQLEYKNVLINLTQNWFFNFILHKFKKSTGGFIFLQYTGYISTGILVKILTRINRFVHTCLQMIGFKMYIMFKTNFKIEEIVESSIFYLISCIVRFYILSP